ncbi:MAG: ferrochelatase [Betaproteobacteria bacterium]|nr:ferrochelatase [Betaproteobacteria bacterium]
MSFSPEPPFAHGSPSKPAILLVNLGTPEAPTPAALRVYLREFLSDRRVIELPRPVWWLILNLFVLPRRPKASAARYAQIWTPEGSPLKVHTQRQAKLLQGYLGVTVKSPFVVDYAMRYGAPSIGEVLDRLRAQGCDRILVLPLYPQYSASSTATVFDAVFAAIRRMRNAPAVRTVKHFHDDPRYIAALARSIRDDWTTHGRPDVLVMSFHGLPRFSLDRGDPYHCECLKTGRLVAEALDLTPHQFRVTFQSRFGRAEWLKPYTADTLRELGAARTERVDVMCPGFVADCLETLEEIALEGKAEFLKAGGGSFHYIPCLNERDDWIRALTGIAASNLGGWVSAAFDREKADREGAAARARALERGARD